MSDRDSERARPARAAMLAAAMLAASGIVAGGQQPNSNSATLSVNGNLAGPPWPIAVGGLQETVVGVGLQGAPGAAGTPFLLAYGRVAAGSAVFPEGIVDLDFLNAGFGILLNGFDPASPFATLAALGPSAAFGGSFVYGLGAAIPAGTQALLTDPASPGGARLTAAADFAPAAAALLHLSGQGLPAPLWQNNGGVVTTPGGGCATGLYLNGELTFVFGAPVDPLTLPPPGPATGSIRIADPAGLPATGSFAVRDDPRLAPGNGRRVVFTPPAPIGTTFCGGLGYQPGTTYTVTIPGAGNPGPLLSIGGQPLPAGATTCFTTRPCTTIGPGGTFLDPVPGPPAVVATAPSLANPPPAAIPAASIAGNRVSVTVSEALRPDTIGHANVRLVNQANGAFVPGSVALVQAGTVPALGTQSRIDYTAFEPFPPGCVYRLEVTAAVTDLVGNPLDLVPGQPGQPLFFATQAAPPVPQPPIVETFTSPANNASIGPNLTWGGGSLSLLYDLTIGGNGAFGAVVFPAGAGTVDTGQPPLVLGGQVAFQDGVYNLTSLAVSAGANLRVFGPFPLHVRCTGTVTIDGVLNANAGNLSTAPLGSPEQGAVTGNFSNTLPYAPGGVGNAGGGNGGRASQADAVGPPTRTPAGEPGFGPRIGGAPNAGPFGANPTFAGGAGGQGGFLFPQGGVPGEVGGLGGAGGSAFASGEQGGPNGPFVSGTCTAVPVAPQTRALATGTPAAMLPPIGVPSAGSGGGGGGDKFDPAGVAGDDAGGGGGGGGGGIRISALGTITLSAGSSIMANGGTGAAGNVFNGGHGGGGSGGEIWIQSLAQVVISAAANLPVNGGGVNSSCWNQAAGRGGYGICQFEDADGVVNTTFAGAPAGGGNIFVLSTASMTASAATSVFFDTFSGNPAFTGGTFSATPGIGTVVVEVQGAHAEVTNVAEPDLATLTAPVPIANIAALSGRRFIRFRATLSYPPGTTPPAALPSVQSVTIAFSI